MDQITFWSPTPRIEHPTRTSTDFLSQPLSPASDLTNAGTGTLIEYLPDHKILVCTQCNVAVPSNDLEIYLRSSHRGIKKAGRVSLHEKFEQLPTVRTTADLQPLPDGSPQLSFLIPPREGYRLAKPTITRSSRVTLRSTLAIYRDGSRDMLYRTNDIGLWLWTLLPFSAAKVDILSQLELEMEEETRIGKDPDIVIDEDLETDENSDWLRAYGWALWFKHKPIPLLVAAASVPFPGCPNVLYLGKWHGVECTSPISVERTLYLVALASQLAIDRCVKTLRKTPRTLRCWARTGAESSSSLRKPKHSIATPFIDYR